MKARKLVTFFSFLIVLSMVLVACGGGATPAPQQATEQPQPKVVQQATQSSAPAATTAPTSQTGGKKKVVVFVGMSEGNRPEQMDTENKLAAQFNAIHPDIEVSYIYVPYETSKQRFLTMVGSNDPPQMACPIGSGGIASDYGVWEDMTPYLKNYDMSDYYAPAMNLIKYTDKNIGLPVGIFPSVIFYNKAIFDAAGLPYPTSDFNDKTWTMDKLREIAMKTTLDKNGKNATEAGFNPGENGNNVVQWGYDDSGDSFDLRGMLTMWGAPDVGRPTSADYKTATLNSPEWLYGFTWLNNAVWKDHFMAPMAVTKARDAAGITAFSDGKTAMYYIHTWWMPDGLANLTFEYGIAPLPFNQKGTRIERIDADTCGIVKTAANKDAAWEYEKWLMEPEQYIQYVKIMGYMPSRISLQDQYKAYLSQQFKGIDSAVLYNSINYLDYPNHESWIPENNKIREIDDATMQALFSGTNKDDPKALLDKCNADVQAVLDQYWATQK